MFVKAILLLSMIDDFTCTLYLRHTSFKQISLVMTFYLSFLWAVMFLYFLWRPFSDCIGSAFNIKGAMQCPNCRKIEKGQWLYANGCRSFPELSVEDWNHDEDLYDLTYSEMVIIVLFKFNLYFYMHFFHAALIFFVKCLGFVVLSYDFLSCWHYGLQPFVHA